MPWTDTTRLQYERKSGRYASDCTDAEWAFIAPFMPERKITGRPRATELRDIWDAIQYMAATGCQWAMIPNDFPPSSTVQRYFYDWRNDGLLHQINHNLVMAARISGQLFMHSAMRGQNTSRRLCKYRSPLRCAGRIRIGR